MRRISSFATERLPPEILAKASLRGNEYAWRIDDIPLVIEVARNGDFFNAGGQLQFRLPDAICECYWVEVDTYKAIASALPWDERVAQSAAISIALFEKLRDTFDFKAEGQKVFGKALAEFKKTGGNVDEAMCFVWYVEAPGARDFAD